MGSHANADERSIRETREIRAAADWAAGKRKICGCGFGCLALIALAVAVFIYFAGEFAGYIAGKRFCSDRPEVTSTL